MERCAGGKFFDHNLWPFNCKLGGVNARWELLRLRYGDTWVGGKGGALQGEVWRDVRGGGGGVGKVF